MIRRRSFTTRSDSLQLGYSLRTQNNSKSTFNSVISARAYSTPKNISCLQSSYQQNSAMQKSINNLPKNSSQREKKLTSKINYMLQQQNDKINDLNSHQNKIKFTPRTKNQNKNASIQYPKIQAQSRKLPKNDTGENKENCFNSNSQQSQAQSPPKLTLRQYFISTPNKSDRNNLSEMDRKEGLSKNLFKFEDQMVLKQVRELKSMFIKLIKEKPEVKTRRKPSILNSYRDDQDKLFTLP